MRQCKLMTAQQGGHTLLCHSRLLLLLGLGWLVSQPLVAQSTVLLALGWQSSLVWPPAQLQRAPPALPNALHVQRCIAVPVQPPVWLWCWLGLGSLALGFAFALGGLGGLSWLLSWTCSYRSAPRAEAYILSII
ncbi:hypothetical protein V8C86DRAFT_71863 [Haematococcus lacustris]